MSDPQLAADKTVPIVHWNEYEISSAADGGSGGEVFIQLYAPSEPEDDGLDIPPIATLVLSPTEVRDLINALEAELPFAAYPGEAPEREHTDHMQDNL